MKTQYYTATSLDGFIATEDDSLEWLFPLGDINDTSYPDFIKGVGALAMGSSTYEWMLRHARKVADETGSAWPYEMPTWVFSSRELPAVPGADLRFARGDVRPVHAAMRAAAGGKNLWIVGGGDLVAKRRDLGAQPVDFGGGGRIAAELGQHAAILECTGAGEHDHPADEAGCDGRNAAAAPRLGARR